MEPKKAKYKLEDLDVVEVSFVPKAANKRKFLLYKAADGADQVAEKDSPAASDVHVDAASALDKKKKKRKAKPDDDATPGGVVSKEAMMHEDILKALEGELEGADEVDVTLKEAKVSERGMSAIKAALMILKAFKDDIAEAVGQQVPVLAGWAAPEPVEVIKEVIKEVEVAPKTEAVKKAEVLESASPEVKAELEKLWKANDASIKKQTELEATIKAEQDAAELSTFVQKASTDFARLPAKAAELGQALQMISKAASNGEADLIDRILKAANEAIAKASEEVGAGGGPEETDVMARVDAQAAEMVKKGEAKSPSHAVTMIFEKNPELYNEYNKQSPVAVIA